MDTPNYEDPANCIFCKIAAGVIYAEVIYEDDSFLSILDLHPATEGYTLVIPKNHFRWVCDVRPFGAYWEAVLATTLKIQKALGPKWVQYITHGEITHAHIRVIPRYDDVNTSPTWLKQPDEQTSSHVLKNVAERIRAAA